MTATPRAATVYDVAAAAGVSVATVSRFLAGNGYVGQASRDKIAEAVATLGYVPNRAAASLKSRRSGLLGFVVSDLQNPFTAEVAASIGAQARVHGFGMVLSDSQGDPDLALEAVELSAEPWGRRDDRHPAGERGPERAAAPHVSAGAGFPLWDWDSTPRHPGSTWRRSIPGPARSPPFGIWSSSDIGGSP